MQYFHYSTSTFDLQAIDDKTDLRLGQAAGQAVAEEVSKMVLEAVERMVDTVAAAVAKLVVAGTAVAAELVAEPLAVVVDMAVVEQVRNFAAEALAEQLTIQAKPREAEHRNAQHVTYQADAFVVQILRQIR